jgi:hypothetical protein
VNAKKGSRKKMRSEGMFNSILHLPTLAMLLDEL